MGSQWSLRSTGVMWEERGTQETRRAAVFRMLWSFEVIFVERPKRRELQLSKRDVTNAWIRRWAVFWSRNLRILLIFLKATKADLHILSTFWDMQRDESMTAPRLRTIFEGSITDCPILTLICGTSEQYLEWKSWWNEMSWLILKGYIH